MTRSARIYVEDLLAGILTETIEGQYIFKYDNDYCADTNTRPISLTLPKRQEAYIADSLFPFFDGLIPEGWLVDIGIRNWKLNRRDRMGLLLHLCRDCIGNVSIIKSEDHHEE